MAEPLEIVGILLACGAAAAAIVMPPGRGRTAALAIALVAAPALVLGDVWDEPRIVDARESPKLIAAAVLAGGVAVGVGALLIRRIGWAFPVLAFLVLAARLPLRIGGETAHLLVPLYLVIASAWVASLWHDDAVPHGIEPPAVVWLKRVLAATLVLYAVQAIYSDDFSNAVENAGFFLVPFAVLFCQLAEVRWDRANLRAITIAIGVVGAFVAAIGIGEYLAKDLLLNQQLLESNQLKPAFRVNSVFFDPNVFGRYLVLGVIALGAAIAWSRGGGAALLATATGVLMLAGLVLSYSITSVAALLAGMGLLAILRYSWRGGIAAAAAILLTGAVFAFTGGADRSDIGPTRGIDEETSGRIDLIKGGWELIKSEPLVGWGSGAFGRAYFDQVRETETTTSHSEPITVAAEQGIPGAIVYLGLLGCMAWTLLGRGAGSSAARAAVAAGILALVVHSFGYAGFLSDPATWALLAVAVALRREPPAAP